MADVIEMRCIEATSLRKFSAEDRLKVLIDAVDNLSVYMIDAEGKVATWNQGAENNKGYTADEIIGRHYSVFFEPSAVAAGQPQDLLARAAREGRVDAEGWRVRKDGRRFWASVHLAAIRNVRGHLLGYAKVTRDATVERERKSLERARDRAVAESKAKMEFLAQMSHEMRTLLNAIVGYTDAMCVLFDSMSDARRRDYLGVVNESSRALLAIVDDILDTRKTVRSIHISSEPVDLLQLCIRVANEFQFTGRLGNKALLYVERRETASGRCDESRLAQVLRNLVSNALKFGGPDVEVILSVEPLDSERARILVDDNGPGVPEGEEEKIFARYYRGDAAREVEGLGMGLALCRDLVRQMDGAIGVCRSPLGGARFWVTLPRVDPALAAGPGEAARSAAPLKLASRRRL